MSINCPFCDHPNSLPGMRQIRQLPLKDEPTGDQAVRTNDAKSMLFSAGLLICVIAAILGFALGKYASGMIKESTVKKQIEFGEDQIDTYPPGHLWEAWDSMTAEGLPDWQETQVVKYNKQSMYLKYISYGLYGISAIGLLALLASFFMRHE